MSSHRPLESLHIYPLKSSQGQQLETMTITSEGPMGDRQWMLIDDQGVFLTQRTVPKLATIQVMLNEQGLNLGVGKQFFVAPAASAYKRRVTVDIWGEKIEAGLEADLFSQAISQYLGVSCRLVRYAPFSKRITGAAKTANQGSRATGHDSSAVDEDLMRSSESNSWTPEVRFADQRPILLMNTKSLEDLNSRLASPVPMNRFRANIVFRGEEALEEDSWSRIRIGEVTFSQPKKCSRCKIVAIDQVTGTSAGPEPLKTLSTYRREGNKVNFGVLWIPENAGTIKRGDSLEVL